MNMKNNKGFSLVELIVVIAIMAILAAVAVVGVSVYIPKAQKAADEQMISDIEEALLLAYYSGELTESGYVVLTMNATANPSDDAVRDTLLAAYGNLDELKLTHDGWKEGGYAGAYASSVKGSFVSTGTQALMTDVQNCTTKLAEYMAEVFSGKEGAAALDGIVNSGTVISDMLSGYDSKDIDKTVLANATVFGIASTMNDTDNAEEIIKMFADPAKLAAPIPTSGFKLTDVAHKYAALEAFVNYMQCDGATEALTVFNTTGMTGSATDIVINLNTACYDAMEAAMQATGGEAKCNAYYGFTADGAEDPNVAKSPARQNGEAYVSTMQTIDSLSGDYVTSLGNEKLFADGTVDKDLQAYLNLADAIPQDDAYYVVSFRVDETGIIFD